MLEYQEEAEYLSAWVLEGGRILEYCVTWLNQPTGQGIQLRTSAACSLCCQMMMMIRKMMMISMMMISRSGILMISMIMIRRRRIMMTGHSIGNRYKLHGLLLPEGLLPHFRVWHTWIFLPTSTRFIFLKRISKFAECDEYNPCVA